MPWGNAEVGADGTWQCQHGPLECTGNTIESCVLHYHKDQDVWFPFVLAFEAAMPICGRGNQTATNNPVACAERIAAEQSLEWAPVAACFEKFDVKTGMPPTDSLGFKLQMEAKAATDALVPKHSGVPTVTFGVQGPYIDAPSQNYLKCFVCAAYTGADAPTACKACDEALPSSPSASPAVAPADAQAVSLMGELFAAPRLGADETSSCELHLAAAQAEYDADVLPSLCKAAASGCKSYGSNFSSCMGNMCCSIQPDPTAPPPGYSCAPQPNEVHDAAKYTALARRKACDGSYRQAMDIMSPIMMGGSGGLDAAHGMFVLGHRQISTRMLGSAEMTLGIATSQANATGDVGNPGITKDVPIIEYDPNPLGIPTESLLGNIWYHYALTEYLLREDAQCDRDQTTGKCIAPGDGLKTAAKAWEWSVRYSTVGGKDCVLPTDDQLVSTVNWLYATYMRMNMTEEAAAALRLVTHKAEPLRVIEETLYANLTAMYANPKELLPPLLSYMNAVEKSAPGDFATLGYAIGNFQFFTGDTLAGMAMWKRVLSAKPAWASFGYIAAEVELFAAAKVANGKKPTIRSKLH